ncbi:hypothetical protein CRE_05296 [Caenorhabditis remanei]|uniref:Integrase catalytic domain-containing protein n=1 Tax=Caenorhabditis remanei TaxID=31234 RepID=E3NNU1_CAERE|nr:hypothetical protein CRE_05296 [Caenorhabditis remanei]
MTSTRVKAAIKDAYTNPKNPSAFTSVANIHKFLKPKFKSLTYEQVEKVLEDLESFTLHRPTRKRFPRLKTLASGLFTDFQADLVDMSKYKKTNNNTTFLLTVIDIYSRRLYVRPLKNKGGVEVSKALSEIFKEIGTSPMSVYTDEGKEFYNTNVKTLFKETGVSLISTKSELKCAVIERANRTLKTRLAKYMTQKYGYKYIDVLQKIVKGINNTLNRGIGKKPVDVKRGDFMVPLPEDVEKRTKFQVGDHVRISAKRQIFDKGYDQGWTTEVFIVNKVLYRKPIVYNLLDTNGEEIEGIFYGRELTKCTYGRDDLYRIEKVLDTRIHKGKKQSRVKWSGYPDSFSSWVDSDSLVNL